MHRCHHLMVLNVIKLEKKNSKFVNSVVAWHVRFWIIFFLKQGDSDFLMRSIFENQINGNIYRYVCVLLQKLSSPANDTVRKVRLNAVMRVLILLLCC